MFSRTGASVSHGNKTTAGWLIKCCPEQLRHATNREQILEHLSTDTDKQAPWTFQHLTEGLGGNEYQDISDEVPTEEEWMQGHDANQAARPDLGPPATPRQRIREKRGPISEAEAAASRQRFNPESNPAEDEVMRMESW